MIELVLYVLFLFYVPVTCLRVPPEVRVPQVGYSESTADPRGASTEMLRAGTLQGHVRSERSLDTTTFRTILCVLD
jgi:hypothetical protein